MKGFTVKALALVFGVSDGLFPSWRHQTYHGVLRVATNDCRPPSVHHRFDRTRLAASADNATLAPPATPSKFTYVHENEVAGRSRRRPLLSLPADSATATKVAPT